MTAGSIRALAIRLAQDGARDDAKLVKQAFEWFWYAHDRAPEDRVYAAALRLVCAWQTEDQALAALAGGTPLFFERLAAQSASAHYELAEALGLTETAPACPMGGDHVPPHPQSLRHGSCIKCGRPIPSVNQEVSPQ